jgi:hypothetical protein
MTGRKQEHRIKQGYAHKNKKQHLGNKCRHWPYHSKGIQHDARAVPKEKITG